jgi:hypothetical protein
VTSSTQLVVIYATGSKILRRTIIPDDDFQLAVHQPGPGESRLLLPRAASHDDASCRAAIAVATGVIPPSGRCCIVDAAGTVIGVCNADPELDAHPAGRLIAHDIAEPRDRHEDGIFKRKYAVIDRASNKVAATVYLPLGNITAPTAGFFVSASDHKVGGVMPDNAVSSPSP